VNEVSEDRPDVRAQDLRKPDIDQLVALLRHIQLAPNFAVHFYAGTDYGVQGVEVFGCPIDLGPDAAQIEARRHGFITYAATEDGA